MKVLFVGMGDTCRSLMAQAVMSDLIDKFRLDWEVDSAGLMEWNVGCTPDVRCVKVLRDHGLETKRCERVITKPDFQKYDFILAMDVKNLAELKKICKSETRKKGRHAKLQLLGKYHRYKEDAIIRYPSYCDGFNGFNCAYAQIYESCKNFIAAHAED